MTTIDETTDFPPGSHDGSLLFEGMQFNGRLDHEEDVDWIPIFMENDWTYIIEFNNTFERPVLEIVNSIGNTYYETFELGEPTRQIAIASAQSSISGNTFVFANVGSTGTYYARVWDGFDGIGNYTINVSSEITHKTNTHASIAFTYENYLAGTYDGTHEYVRDYDMIAGQFEAGRTYVITLENNPGYGSTYFGVHDENGDYIRPDNAVYSESRTKVAFTPEEDGTYYLRNTLTLNSGGSRPAPTVGDQDYTMEVRHEAAANSQTQYSISQEDILFGTTISGRYDFLGDADWYSLELAAGTSYLLLVESGGVDRVRFIDAGGNDVASTSPAYSSRNYHVVTPEASGTYYVYVEGNTFEHGFSVLSEIAGDVSTTKTLDVGRTLYSAFDYGGDRDVVAVDVTAGVEYQITADLDGASNRRLSIDILDAQGERLAPRTGSQVDMQSRTFTPETSGRIFIELDENSRNWTPIDYSLEVVPALVDPGDVIDVEFGTPTNDRMQIIDETTGLDGAGGFDIATLAQRRGGVRVTNDDDGTFTLAFSSRSVSLENIERLELTDGTIALDLTGAAGQAYRLYQAAFDRTPDDSGLSHNVNLMDGGLSIFDMAAAFIASQEFQNTYGPNISNTAFITLLYQNVLNRAPDDAGLAGWLDAMNGGQSHAQVLFGFSESTENKANVASAIDDGIWLV